MKIISTQFITLTLLIFSSASCLKIDVNWPTEKPAANDSKPPGLTAPKPPVLIEPIRAEPIEPLANDWRIALTTDGGYAGGGTGNFVAESSGKFFFQKPRRMGVLPAPCETKLSAEETENLETLADDWRVPDEIGRNALKLAASDAYHFKTEISSGSGRYELEFYENTDNILPSSNRNLVKALFDLREKACGESGEK